MCATEKREYNNEFTEYKSELVYSEPFYGKYYSVRTIEKSGKEKQAFYYTDAKFTLLAKEYIYSADGSYIVKNILSERNGKGCLSTIDYFNNENKWIKSYGYSDNNFNDIEVTVTNNYNDSMVTTIYEKPFCNNIMATLEFCGINNKVKEEKQYKDKSLLQLYLTVKYEYNAGNTIEKWNYSEQNKEEHLSCIRYLDKKDRYIKGAYFYDDDFSDLGCTCNVKYLKNSHIRLYYFKKPSDGYFSQIEKYDNKNNLIYSKNYRFKVFYPKICFGWRFDVIKSFLC